MKKENDAEQKHIGPRQTQATRRDRQARMLNFANAIVQKQMIDEQIIEGPIDPGEVAAIISKNPPNDD